MAAAARGEERSWVRLDVQTSSHDKWRQYLVMSLGAAVSSVTWQILLSNTQYSSTTPPVPSPTTNLMKTELWTPCFCYIIVSKAPPEQWRTQELYSGRWGFNKFS
jgi:hypothetical protein